MDAHKSVEVKPGASTVSSIFSREEAIWQRFGGDSIGDIREFSENWLGLLSCRIQQLEAACVVLRLEEAYKPVAQWSAGSNGAGARLSNVAEEALRERKTVILAPTSSELQVGYPLVIDDELTGVVALSLPVISQAEVTTVIRHIQWGAVWFENYFRIEDRRRREALHHRLTSAFSLASLSLEHPDLNSAALALVTEWASSLGCDRVALGLSKGRRCQVIAISHDVEFDKRTNVVRLLGNAMDEAVDQKCRVRYPRVAEEREISRSHRLLKEHSGSGSVATVLLSTTLTPRPKSSKGMMDGSPQIIGAVTLEHADPDFFDDHKLALCEQIGLLLGPLLKLREQEEQWIGRKLIRSANGLAQRWLGAGFYRTKLATVAVTALTLFFALFTTEYRVAADATLEGWTQRYISSPIDGFIASSHVKPGDEVKTGDVLFSLDNRDLELEQQKWVYKKTQVEQQHLAAMVEGDFAQAGILNGQLEQAQAQLQLIAEQLSRTEAKAPFDGVVVSGDLSQSLGAPVSRGDSLMRIAQLGDYRLILAVPENDIDELAINQQGQVILAALNDEAYEFVVEKVTPVAKADQGATRFRVEARILNPGQQLRPGMQGTAKVQVGERKLWWIWTHGLSDWLTLWFWRWWP
ncbi:GAF domain protein [Oleiphilus messinensis]|uniref:GAF domain protein n=1 Tax=Oleiphilus messinensis TaxID=141451 RepID=A0A1Y0IF87_9GAMM|nr:efflux RND transporter periplasmic adaptor subunit [Oleiphilus messinensis]ARU58044.1 GAF domain protein [Oleiphilus messinensis]